MGEIEDAEGQERRFRFSRRKFLAGSAVVGAVAAVDPFSLSAAGAATNPIVTENAKPGAAGWDWTVTSEEIQGFASPYSVNAGQRVDFKVSTPSNDFTLNVYRIGYYGGAGARLIQNIPVTPSLAHNQPAPFKDASLGLVDCGNWRVTASWNVPSDAVSGVYVANLDSNDGFGSNVIIFVVRNDGRAADIMVQTSDATYQAYNRYGGYSLYGDYVYGDSKWGRAVKVSYNRPFWVPEIENTFHYAEAPMVRWLERNGYDVAYCGSLDTHLRPAELLSKKVFVSHGHDEYISGAARANIEAARDAGVNLVFMTGNEVFWRTRFEPSFDGTNTPNRTLVCYKETLADAKIDPASEWTGTWRDPRFGGTGAPENGLTGTLFKAINPQQAVDFTIKVPYLYSRLRIWRNTSIANLQPGETATLAAETLGYEWNTDEPNAARPKGLIRQSETTETADAVIQDYGSTYITAPLTHYLTQYRAPSGALVWSTGTCQWSWGLDNYHLTHPGNDIPADVRMQQATLNVLADMGVQPATRQSNLVAATKSTDTVPPVSTMSSPAAGSSVTIGSAVTVQGSAVDSGGGQVAAVEVSTDGGTTWAPATGTTSWSYTFRPTSLGPIVIKTRATDDSNNIETPGAGRTITGVPRSYPLSIWPAGTAPTTGAGDDATALELGVRFQSSVDGFVTGLRFYKGAGNTGTHVGHLWTNAGARLGTVTFANETASGWQDAKFDAPIPVLANTTYVASYYAPNGHYPVDPNYFDKAWVLPPLTALANDATNGNGVFTYNAGGGFPTSAFKASNYWVDITFDIDDHIAPTVIDRSPAPGISAVALNGPVQATFSEGMNASSISMQVVDSQGATVPGSVTYNASTFTASFTPTAPFATAQKHTVTVTAKDKSGASMAAPASWSFTTTAAVGTVPATLWDTSAVPQLVDSQDPNPLETGVRFTSNVDGSVVALRFYKSPSDTGTHVGHLWKTDGTLLASATYQNETRTGWQEVKLDAPVQIARNTVYIASMHSTTGNYPVTKDYFIGGYDRGLLHAPELANGAFKYGDAGLPTDTWQSSNYWIDLVMDAANDTTAPTVVDTSPAADVNAVVVGSKVSATFSEPVKPTSVSFSLKTSAGAAVAGTTVNDVNTSTATFTPSQPLATDATYTATVNATDFSGNALATKIWSFTTVSSPGASPATIWDSSAVPAIAAADDTNSVEVGVRFQSDTAGTITGLRFYKGPGNTGTHVGHLWTGTGTLLGSVVFANETATGWQQANFDSAIPISANTTYVASYFAPSGRYAASNGGLATTVNNAPLHALGDGVDGANGLFGYGSGAFPTESFGSGNYWIDVVFTGTVAPRLTARTPADTATAVPLNTTVTGTFNLAVTASTVAIELRDSGGALVAGTGAYDGGSRVVTFTPSAALLNGTTYTARVSGATTSDGLVMAPTQWSFTTVGATPTGSGQIPASGATKVATNATVSLVSSQALQPSSIAFELRTSTNAVVPGAVAYDSPTRRITFTPSAALAEGMTYTARLTAATSTFGTAMAPISWSFSTVAAPVTVFAANATPSTVQVSSNTAVELGMKFHSTVNGQVLGVRFYKGTANTGTHIGHLWSSSGTLLATVTFTGETASGWQTARFSNPVNITANTNYVVSYLAPVGRYAQNTNGFGSEQGTGQVRGNRNSLFNGNGVYRNTTTGAFPNNTSLTSYNYWVDVLFRAT